MSPAEKLAEDNLRCQDGLPTFVADRLVKYEDLNHHGTLFAGRGAEWFVENGFIVAASLTKPENIVCAKVHGMIFRRPVPKGSIVHCESKAVLAGKTSITVYVHFGEYGSNAHIVDGFLTFVHVDKEGKPTPHGLVLTPKTGRELELQAQAKAL